jgi:hypothetical protein
MRVWAVVADLKLAAATVAGRDSGAPVLVTQGWEDVLCHTTNHRTNVLESKLAFGHHGWVLGRYVSGRRPTGEYKGGFRTQAGRPLLGDAADPLID